jgi:hypothetical protein
MKRSSRRRRRVQELQSTKKEIAWGQIRSM